MAEAKPAASSTTPQSSCERIITEFQANGRPEGGSFEGAKGQVLGGLAIKTPQVGDGFVEWAVAGYSLEGVNAPTPGLNYDKSGDWAYDRQTVEQGKHARYIPEIKANQK
jgi:hypothetical protein